MQDSDEIKSTTTEFNRIPFVTTTEKDKLNRISDESVGIGLYNFTKTYTYCNDNLHTNGTTNCVNKCEMKVYGSDYRTDTYEYDVNYNITGVTRREIDTINPTDISYTYDAYNRLVRENNQALGKTYTYEYDAGGNITRKREYSYTTGTLGSATNTYSYTYGNAMKDRLTVWNGKSFSYDNCGNPTTYKDEALTWTRGRLLSSYTKNGTKYSFTYDVNGIRRRKTTSAGYTEYLVSNGNLVQQNYYASGSSTPSWNIIFLHAHTGIIGFIYGSNICIYHKDIFGNVISLWSGNTMAAKYEYDAWGNCKVLNPDGTENTDANFVGNINPIRYRSYYFDTDLGLYYLQTRWYDPEIGRFINLDQIEYLDPETLNGLNLYAYCLNNPVMGVDPNGTSILAALIIIGAIIGAAIGFGATVVADYLDDGEVFNGSISWQTYVGATLLGGVTGAAIGAGIAYIAPAISSFMGSSFTLGSFIAASGEAVAISVTGAQIVGAIAALGTLILLAKRTGKEGSTDKPSWVNQDMVDPDLSAQQNATNFLNDKYGIGNWSKGPGSEFQKIWKWIQRTLFYRR